MRAVYTDVSEQGMVRAIEANHQGAWSGFGRSPGCETNQTAEATWMFTGVQDPLYNNVVRSQFEPDDAGDRIVEILAYYASRRAPTAWWLGPSARPSDLGARLEAHGMVREADPPGMALDTHTLDDDYSLPPGLIIERADDAETLATLMHVSVTTSSVQDSLEHELFRLTAGAGYGPGQSFRHYLGLLDGKPVATGGMHVGDSVVGITNITVVPEARRRGIGTAISRAPVLEARDLGYRIACLQSSKMAFPMYERMGFREYMKFAVYVTMVE